MKQLSFLLLFFVHHYAIGQTYKFDQLTTLELAGKNKVIATTQKLTNSEDLYYAMDFNSKNVSELIDFRTFQRHFFNVIKQKDDHFVFDYVRTCDEKDIRDDVKNTGRDYRFEKSVDSQYILGKYDSSTSKYPYFEVRFQMEEAKSNQLGLVQTIDFELLEKFVGNISKAKKYSIKKLDYYVNGKKGKEQVLKSVASVDVEVKLPEKLYLKCLKVF